MWRSLIMYKSVSPHKPESKAIILEFLEFSYGPEHFAAIRLKDRSRVNGNKRGILGLVAFHNLTKWEKEE